MGHFRSNLRRGVMRKCLTLASAALVLPAACGLTASAQAAASPPTLATLLARAQIHDLLVDYYRGFTGDQRGFASFYVKDGILDVNGIVARGRKAINALYAENSGGGRRTGLFRMLLTNVKISVHGTTATADAIWTGINDENVKATPRFVEQGREHDDLVERGGHWYLKHRWITADAGLPAMYDKTYKPRDLYGKP
jgi:SnoaL-like domain